MGGHDKDATTLEVWGRRNSINVQKVLWCCEELALTYRLVDAGGAYGRTDTAGYLAMNPMGLVPTLVDGSTVVWESNAIVRYLSRYYGEGVLWPSEKPAYARAETWMNWQPMVWLCLRPAFMELIRTPEGQRDQQVVDDCVTGTIRHLNLLERHLAQHDYIAGAAFSMGDIPLGVTANRWLKLVDERPAMPNIEAWVERLCQREPYREVVAGLPLS